MERDEIYKKMLEWRNIDPRIDTVCKRCGGSGIRSYGDTSTWQNGIGGQTITSDVCDKCWGSGKENAPWANLRVMKSKLRAQETPNEK